MESPRETARALRRQAETALHRAYGPFSPEVLTFNHRWRHGTWLERATLCAETLRDCQAYEAWERRWGSL